MATIYEKSVGELLKDFIFNWFKNNDVFVKNDAIEWFYKNYPDINYKTVEAHLEKFSINYQSRIHRNVNPDGRDDILVKDKHTYRKYNKLTDPEPIYNIEEKRKIKSNNNVIIDNSPHIENKITEAYEILYSHRNEMDRFMNFYVFKRMNIDKDTFLENENDFLKFVEFCLKTIQRPNNNYFSDGLEYFKNNYLSIKLLISQKNIEELKSCVYKCPGVGQKIGSMLLEFIYLYSNKKDNEIANTLYVPLDTHVLRLLNECFHLNNIPQTSNQINNIENIKFINFQNSLKKYTSGKPIIYFDYLWFIGKMFCNKINEENEMSKGYKLCNYCWLNKCCGNENKWI